MKSALPGRGDGCRCGDGGYRRLTAVQYVTPTRAPATRSGVGATAADGSTQLIPQGVAVDAISKQIKEILHLRVFDGFPTDVRFEMPFGHVRSVRCPMDEDVIPRLVFGWTGSSDLIVPLVRPLKGFVHSHDHASVFELPMMNRLPDGEGAHQNLTSRALELVPSTRSHPEFLARRLPPQRAHLIVRTGHLPTNEGERDHAVRQDFVVERA